MDEPTIYQIVVQGELSENWQEWFGGLAVCISHHGGEATTILSGPVTDQAALRGILSRLWDLNLVLLSVNLATQVEPFARLGGSPSERAGSGARD